MRIPQVQPSDKSEERERRARRVPVTAAYSTVGVAVAIGPTPAPAERTPKTPDGGAKGAGLNEIVNRRTDSSNRRTVGRLCPAKLRRHATAFACSWPGCRLGRRQGPEASAAESAVRVRQRKESKAVLRF